MDVKVTERDIDASQDDRKRIAHGLSAFLADSFSLYLMTHNFHWNVTGPQFVSLHNLFMAQYTEQWNALEIIAERIRALGHAVPGTQKEFLHLSSVKEIDGVPHARAMILDLMTAHEATARTARKLLPTVNAAHDNPTADLLSQRIEAHEKSVWMLRSLLEN